MELHVKRYRGNARYATIETVAKLQYCALDLAMNQLTKRDIVRTCPKWPIMIYPRKYIEFNIQNEVKFFKMMIILKYVYR